jgi:chemotaxis protein methyltransferase CheR
VNQQDFALLSGLLKERSGLSIGMDKVYLLESRLTPVARRLGMAKLEDLVAEVRRNKSEPLLRDITEAMTTNESFFFRDGKPFDAFRDEVLPALLAARKDTRSIRIWSAACSTGQEAYSIAMILKEQQAKLSGYRFEIVGTDISREVLEKAKVGLYSQFEVQRGLPIQMLMKYFTQVKDLWQIDGSLRAMARFREYNLLSSLASLGKFDVIFCRNVLIYFDQETKGKVLGEMRKLLPPDGALFLGAAETVLGISDAFKPLPGQRGIYGPA